MDPKIKFNPRLFWDYDIKEEDLAREKVLIFYISRVLNNGSMKDVKELPEELIKKYFDQLQLSKRVRLFWAWYFANQQTVNEVH